MQTFKKAAAVIIVVALALGLTLSANAAGSPTSGQTSTAVNPGYNPQTGVETNTSNHNGNTVETKIANGQATVQRVTADNKEDGSTVTISTANNASNTAIAVTAVGDGENGVFDSDAGRLVKKLYLRNSDSNAITVAANALKGSNVGTVALYGPATIEANAFKGTKKTVVKIYIKGAKKKASAFKFKKGAFKGLKTKSCTFIVKKGSMSKSEFNKLRKKLVKAGFKGTIKRK